MKVLSLFDGISGARQALKELNIDCEYYASEIDKFAIQVSKANHPDIKQIGDVKGIVIEDGYLFYNQNNHPMKNGGSFKADIDLLVGGFPCQSFSIAGNQKGFADERGQLFFEALRILEEVKPKYFLFENVNSMSKKNKALIDEKLGVGHVMINSALLTAQQRKRVYWVGKLVNGKYEQINIEQPEDQKIYLKDIIEEGFVDREKSYCIDANYHKGGNLKSYFEKNRRQLVFDKPFRVGHFNKGGQGDRVYSTAGKSVSLSALGGGRGAKTGLYAIAQRGRNIVDGKRQDVKGSKTEQRFETSYNEKANCLTSVQKDSLLLDLENYIIRKLTVKECNRLQGFPDCYFEDKDKQIISNSQAYKCLGNSFTVPVIKHILKF